MFFQPVDRTSCEIGNHITLFLMCLYAIMATPCGPILSGWAMLHILNNLCWRKVLLGTSLGTSLGTQPLSFPETDFSNAKSSKLLWLILFSPHSPSSLLTDSCLWTLHKAVFWKLGLSIISGSLRCQRKIFKVKYSITNRPENLVGIFFLGFFLFWLWQYGAKTKA